MAACGITTAPSAAAGSQDATEICVAEIVLPFLVLELSQNADHDLLLQESFDVICGHSVCEVPQVYVETWNVI